MWFFELRRDSRVTMGNSGFLLCWPRKSNLPFELPGSAGDWAPFTEGQTKPHLGLCPGLNIPVHGRQGSWGCIPFSPGESGLISRGSKGLHSLLESRQVSLGAH